MTDAERHAKEVCKDCCLREGYHDGYIIRFSSHPTIFKFADKKVTLTTGYGIYFQDTGERFADSDEDGRPVPYNSYWEALAELGWTARMRDERHLTNRRH